MQPSIGERVIGHATPAWPHRPSNCHHQLDPRLPTEQISDDSMFNVLQLNANGFGNKLTELGVVLERNKIKVAVIQESKLSPKSRTTRKDRSYGQGEGLLIFIHRSITFSKQPSSPELLSDPHLEEPYIKVDHFQCLHPVSQFLQ